MRHQLSIACALLLFAASCSWMSDGQVEIFEHGASISRSEAVYELQNAILLNMGLCSQNRAAGLYGAGAVVGEELTRSHYERTSIENCVALVIATPCGLSPDTSTLVFANLYRMMIRGCAPVPMGL